MIRVANAPCSWGVLEFEGMGPRSAAADVVLDEMMAAGYTGTELGDYGFMPTTPEDLAGALNARKLALVGAFVPVPFRDPAAHARGEREALKVASLLRGVSSSAYVVLSDDNGTVDTRTKKAGRIGPEDRLSPGELETFAAGVERVARKVKDETGVSCVFHHHCAGFIETPEEVRALMDATDPALVGLCLDTGHYAYGGGNPLDALREHGQRIRHVHFKDLDPVIAEKMRAEERDYFEAVRAGIFCGLGAGMVPFSEIVQALNGRGFEGWIVVEQDVLPGMGSPKENAERSRSFLRTLGL